MLLLPGGKHFFASLKGGDIPEQGGVVLESDGHSGAVATFVTGGAAGCIDGVVGLEAVRQFHLQGFCLVRQFHVLLAGAAVGVGVAFQYHGRFAAQQGAKNTH